MFNCLGVLGNLMGGGRAGLGSVIKARVSVSGKDESYEEIRD